MTVACVLITHFIAKTELQRRPDLSGQPVIIYQASGSRPLVLDHSQQVRGVSPGMTLEAALSRCREATLLKADVPHYQADFDRTIRDLQHCAEKVEPAEPGCAYIGSWELEPGHGGAREVIDSLLKAIAPSANPRVGVAPGKFPAYVAARRSGAGQATVAPEDVAAWLRRCSVNLLPLSGDLKPRLHKFGLYRLGQVADLGEGPMQAQFGPPGRRAWYLANGVDDRPLLPEPYREEITESLTFPASTRDIEAISRVMRTLLERVFARREVRGRYVRGVAAQGQIYRRPPWVKRFAFKEPLGDPASAYLVIRSALETQTFAGPLEDLSLTVVELTSESGRQGSLFADLRDHSHLADAIQQMEFRHGKSPVSRVVAWEPESLFPERRYVDDRFQPLNPPVPIRVRENRQERPAALLLDRRWRLVRSIEDLWVLDNAEWWRETPGQRTYYEVITENSQDITIYRDLADGVWYRQRA